MVTKTSVNILKCYIFFYLMTENTHALGYYIIHCWS